MKLYILADSFVSFRPTSIITLLCYDVNRFDLLNLPAVFYKLLI
nr:MAG TPA: hypothetical protein [Caudoviricetes sp.]